MNHDKESIFDIWKSVDAQLESSVHVNKKMSSSLSTERFKKQIRQLNRPKRRALLIGIPYFCLLTAVVFLSVKARAPFVAIGFGAIALVMFITLSLYIYQLVLIRKLRTSDQIVSMQKRLSRLRLTSFTSLHLALFQLPFWSICWMSLDALKEDPIFYGGTNLLVFLVLSFLAFWLYKQLHPKSKYSWLKSIVYSGNEWEPLIRSLHLLDEIKEFEAPQESAG